MPMRIGSETARCPCATWSSATADLVRARSVRHAPSSAGCCRWPPAASSSTRRRSSRREPPRGLRFRPVPRQRAVARAGRAACSPNSPTPCSTPRPPASTVGEGDEIIQIGATRIVAGKLRGEDVFDQLVDPQRAIPEAGIPSTASRRRWCRARPPSPGAARLPRLRRRPCWWRTTPPSTCASSAQAALHRRRLRPAGARHAAAVGGGTPAAGIAPAGGDRRAPGRQRAGRHTAVGDAMVTAEIFR